ncbi:glycoside hydrolase family 76 protein [Podospora aff. communis PSN243]|uniref:Glycoside hydrolase family 76 protein n=1 Tax=Podospora aff. communis PSN243 TaxID=3040156 RepID=A0AAV9H8N1_9PEZI|nr:glycoside hydrolase family 76 protein [Podospora aff. communis PSN243]
MKVGNIASIVGLAALCSAPRDELDYTGPAETAIDSMNQFYYDEDQGRWSPETAWWLSGFALQDILDFMHKTGSRRYLQQARHIGNFRADSTDDTGWWALALLRMFDITGDYAYLNISIQDEAYMSQYRTTDDCNGGILQDIRHMSYKNAISNQLYMLLTAFLHTRIPNDTTYLSKALATWDWLHASAMLNPDYLFNDGLAKTSDGVCYNKKLPTWTYNQGVILGALTELFHATGNHTYLTTATSIASAVISSPSLSPSSILTEPCEGTEDGCNNDQEVFKGIFAKHLARLSKTLEDDPYREYLEGNARSVVREAKGDGGLFDVSWKGPFERGVLVGRRAVTVGLFVGLI